MPQASEEGYWSAQVPSLAVAVSVSLIISSSNCSPIAKECSHTGAMPLRSPALLGSHALWLHLPSVLPFQYRTAALAPSTSLLQICISAGRKPPVWLPHLLLSTSPKQYLKVMASPKSSKFSLHIPSLHQGGSVTQYRSRCSRKCRAMGAAIIRHTYLGVPAVPLAVYAPESGKSSESQRKKYASLELTVSGWL